MVTLLRAFSRNLFSREISPFNNITTFKGGRAGGKEGERMHVCPSIPSSLPPSLLPLEIVILLKGVARK